MKRRYGTPRKRREGGRDVRNVVAGAVGVRAGVLREIVDGLHVVGHGDDAADEEETETGDAKATNDIEEDELP